MRLPRKLPVDQAKQHGDHEHIDGERNEKVFEPLFDIPTQFRVGITGKLCVNPGEEHRTQRDFPHPDHADRQQHGKDDYL